MLYVRSSVPSRGIPPHVWGFVRYCVSWSVTMTTDPTDSSIVISPQHSSTRFACWIILLFHAIIILCLFGFAWFVIRMSFVYFTVKLLLHWYTKGWGAVPAGRPLPPDILYQQWQPSVSMYTHLNNHLNTYLRHVILSVVTSSLRYVTSLRHVAVVPFHVRQSVTARVYGARWCNASCV